MRGTSVIAICQMPTMRREITVRNVVFGELRLARRARPTTARRDASPHLAAVAGRPPYRFGHAGRVTLPFVPAARSVIAPYQNFGPDGHA